MSKPTDRYAYSINPDDELAASVKILRLVGNGKRVLELGTASGSMTSSLRSLNSCVVVGVEIDPATARLAEPYCEKMIVGDLDRLDFIAELEDDRFDVILAADVLEHLVDPWRLLEQAGKFLNPDGYLVISVPNVAFSGLLGSIFAGDFTYRNTGLLDQTHLRFFTRHELEIALVSCGFIPDKWECAELGAIDSEFGKNWRILPEQVKQALSMNQDGNTYQFIVRAYPADRVRLVQYLRNKKQLVDEEMALARRQLEGATTEQAESRRLLKESRTVLYLKEQRLEQVEKDLQALLTSTSWRLTAPLRFLVNRLRLLRMLGRFLRPRRLQMLGRFLRFMGSRPDRILPSCAHMFHASRRDGLPGVRQVMVRILLEISPNELWARYQQRFKIEIEPEIIRRITRMSRQPMISILMPTYNTDATVLRETIESVLSQLYPAWQLCIVDDGSTESHVRTILDEHAARDNRIKPFFAESNAGISAATNCALGMADGEFVILLDHDDKLEKQALYRVAESILADKPDFVYSDEALMTEDGTGIIGYVFRPAFSLELLRSHPYIVHLVAFRTSLLRELGGLDVSLSISQDYDLILRVVEQAETIVHIPEILYRWRQCGDSAGHRQKDQVVAASKGILQRHLDRCHEQGEIQKGKIFNFFETRYPVPDGVRVAIIIPTKNNEALLRQCVESIKRTVKQVPYDLIIVDHKSDERLSLEYLDELRAHNTVLRNEDVFNFSAINNWAVSQLTVPYTHFLFCNNDIDAKEPGWLERMMELAVKKDVGIVGAALFYPDNDLFQHAGVCVGMFGLAEHCGKWLSKWKEDGSVHPGYLGSFIANHEVSAVTAACMLIRRDVFEKVKGYDEDLAVGFGDVDLCLRTRRAGYRVIYCPHAELIHHESYTRGKSCGEDPHPLDSALFRSRWQRFLEDGDPCYNPNLSLFSTAWDVQNPLPVQLYVKRRVNRKEGVAS